MAKVVTNAAMMRMGRVVAVMPTGVVKVMSIRVMLRGGLKAAADGVHVRDASSGSVMVAGCGSVQVVMGWWAVVGVRDPPSISAHRPQEGRREGSRGHHTLGAHPFQFVEDNEGECLEGKEKMVCDASAQHNVPAVAECAF